MVMWMCVSSVRGCQWERADDGHDGRSWQPIRPILSTGLSQALAICILILLDSCVYMDRPSPPRARSLCPAQLRYSTHPQTHTHRQRHTAQTNKDAVCHCWMLNSPVGRWQTKSSSFLALSHFQSVPVQQQHSGPRSTTQFRLDIWILVSGRKKGDFNYLIGWNWEKPIECVRQAKIRLDSVSW
jgi:hypothetical protein